MRCVTWRCRFAARPRFTSTAWLRLHARAVKLFRGGVSVAEGEGSSRIASAEANDEGSCDPADDPPIPGSSWTLPGIPSGVEEGIGHTRVLSKQLQEGTRAHACARRISAIAQSGTLLIANSSITQSF